MSREPIGSRGSEPEAHASGAPGPAPESQQSVLDAMFDEILERLEHGEQVLAGAVARGRSDLVSEAERLIALAERVSVVRPRGWPQVPGYTILGELGKGGMGTVYLARQERLGGRPVALKVLPSAFELSGRSRERFLLEARAVARLRHPHIVAIHDVVELREVCAFAMEWVDGFSLSQLIDAVRGTGENAASVRLSRVLEPDGHASRADTAWPLWTATMGATMARALAAVHEAGLLHRDVKPSNILVRRDGTALLSDFGLVRETSSSAQTVSGQFVGTPSYAAPEQLRAERRLDARTDVYGLGVTLYHALALRRPYDEESIPRVLARIEAGRVEPLRRVNPRIARDLDTIVMKAIEAEPSRRYAGAAEMGEDLERLVTLRPIRARPSGPATRALKLVRRNRGRVVGGVIGGALAVACAAALVFLVFLAPRWHARLVTEARVALVGSGFMNGVFNQTYGGVVKRQAAPEIGLAEIDDASHLYDRAARLPVARDESVRLEREIVRVARALVTGQDSPMGAGLRQRLPVTAEYADRFDADGELPAVDADGFPGADAADLRCLGLLGILVGDYKVALEAWPRLDTHTTEDPLVESALGYMYLMLDRPELAYPRLQAAATLLPDVGFIHTLVADAAVKVGDYERAERILESAEGMAQHDPQMALVRVRMDLMDALGRHAEAEALFRGDMVVGNPLCAERAARIRESRGDLAGAVSAIVGFPVGEDWREGMVRLHTGVLPRFRAFETYLVGVCDRWWAAQDAASREAFVRAASASGECYERYVLERYKTARDRLAGWPAGTPLGLPSAGRVPHPATTFSEPAPDPAAPIVTVPLIGVCDRLGIVGCASVDGARLPLP